MDDAATRDLIVYLGLLVGVAALLSPWGQPEPPAEDKTTPAAPRDELPPIPPMH